ncbi:MAG TPA: UDP-glucose/GDP-mannose dehydrogenase family protein, partial [Sphingobacteriaceae bacterium]
MQISIFGLGYVGCVSLGCLAKNGHRVTGVDVSETKVGQINSGLPTIIEDQLAEIILEGHLNGTIAATTNYREAVRNTDISIIAVGTPSTATGHLNLNYIYNVAKNIGEGLRQKQGFHIIAIRSTVRPGTTEKCAKMIEKTSGKREGRDFAMVSNPEFLREGSAVRDYFNPPITLIGTSNKRAAEQIAQLYSSLPGQIIFTDIKVAEMMKYVNNAFHALKVSFANEVGNICKAAKIDSHQVMEIFCMDRQLNISPYYLKPGFAYGGSCLPKDLKGLQTLAHDLYVEAPLIQCIDKTNQLQISRAVEMISHLGKRKLGFLGLSFKQGTDDLRNSPAVAVIEALLGKGFEIKIYDKHVNLSRLTG